MPNLHIGFCQISPSADQVRCHSLFLFSLRPFPVNLFLATHIHTSSTAAITSFGPLIMLSEELETDVPLYTLQTYHYDASSSSFTLESSQHSLPSTHVLIKTTHSGICFTDVHAKPFGCGLGHEGIGHIKALGPSVKGFSVGDRVGWGWLHTSCKECRTCKDGMQIYGREESLCSLAELNRLCPILLPIPRIRLLRDLSRLHVHRSDHRCRIHQSHT